MTNPGIGSPAHLHERFAIAIDGPAAAGKSTVADLVARDLHAVVFDTGVLYRAVTLIAVQRGIATDDEDALAEVAATMDVDIRPPTVADGRKADIFVEGRDVTWDLRSQEVDRALSPIAALPAVRHALLETQRRVGRSGRVVIVGRDIGTVVLPDADLKIYLMASAHERARRRYRELVAGGADVTYESVLESLIRRDKIDSERALAPLMPADDAIVIDSDNVPAVDVARRIVAEFARVRVRAEAEK